MNTLKRRFSASWLFLLLTFGTTLFFHFHLEQQQRLEKAQGLNLPFIPNVTSARMMSLGFDQLLADCFWLSFIGYVGDGKERAKDHYALADEYLSLIVGLDPYLTNAYWFAAFAVGSEQKNPSRAAEIIEVGIRANQDNWYLPFIAGINQYLYAGNELAAAKYYRIASKYPEAPDWLSRQAEILESGIPSTIKEINVWDNVYTTSGDPRVKEMARQKLIELWRQVLASRPPQKIRETALKALSELGVDLKSYWKYFRKHN